VNSGEELLSRLADVEADSLLPGRRRSSSAPPSVAVRDALALDDDLVLAVFAEGDGYLVAPLVVLAAEPVRRAEPGHGVFERLMRRLAAGGTEGRFTFDPIGTVPEAGGERAIEVDQSNESVVVGGQVVVKLYPRIGPGPQPGLDLPVHLAAVGFASIPPPFGAVTWHNDDGDSVLVATASAFLPGATDGWDWYLELALAWLRGDASDDEAFAPAPTLGRLAGDLHAALATASRVLPSPVRMADRSVIAAWRRRAERSLDEAVALTEGEAGDRLRARQGRARSVFEVFDQVEAASTMRIHGDLHVGQFLRWSGGLAVADFDGNPLAPADERVALDTPVRDVAALLRSIDHLGRIAQRRDAGSLEAIERWIARSREDLLGAYLAALDAWRQRSLYDPRLLFPLEVAQECHEFAYAARYLPSWVSVPDLAMRSMFP
jgi:maltokinase